MPYTTVATNDVLTASHFNANYRDQVVSTVTSGTRPSGTEGQVIYETDTNRLYIYNGTGWQSLVEIDAHDSWTLTVSGTGWALGNATTASQWTQVGRNVFFNLAVTWGSSSTFGAGTLAFNLPTNNRSGTRYVVNAMALDASARVALQGDIASNVLTPLAVNASATYATLQGVTSTVPFTWVSGDALVMTGWYESSS